MLFILYAYFAFTCSDRFLPFWLLEEYNQWYSSDRVLASLGIYLTSNHGWNWSLLQMCQGCRQESKLLTALLGSWANSLGCGELLVATWEIAERTEQQREELTDVIDSAQCDAWISWVVRGELCEKFRAVPLHGVEHGGCLGRCCLTRTTVPG